MSTDEESAAEPDLERLRKETSRLKRDMQILYEEKLADFIKSEKQILNSNLQKVRTFCVCLFSPMIKAKLKLCIAIFIVNVF